MARTFECPKCGTDISDSFQEAEPDVGIMGSGWYCDTCAEGYSDEDGSEPHDDDVALFGGSTRLPEPKLQCPTHPEAPLEMGYGLAGGGGLGSYMYCSVCGSVLGKDQKNKETLDLLIMRDVRERLNNAVANGDNPDELNHEATAMELWDYTDISDLHFTGPTDDYTLLVPYIKQWWTEQPKDPS